MMALQNFLSLYLIKKSLTYKKPLVFILLWLIFPPLTQIISRSPMYDGIRHFLVILPPMSILVGFTVYQFGISVKKLYKKNLNAYYFFILIISIGYLNLLLINIFLVSLATGHISLSFLF